MLVHYLIMCTSEIYDPFTKKDIARIEKFENYFTRTAFKRCKLPYYALHESLEYITSRGTQDGRCVNLMCA